MYVINSFLFCVIFIFILNFNPLIHLIINKNYSVPLSKRCTHTTDISLIYKLKMPSGDLD